MRRRNWTVIWLLALCAIVATRDVVASADEESPIDCSIINLLATPERYAGKQIRTYGYVVAEFEDTAIYFSADDMRNRTSVNGIWLAIAETAPGMTAAHGRLSILEGTFDKGRGYADAFGGTLRHITRISPGAVSVEPAARPK